MTGQPWADNVTLEPRVRQIGVTEPASDTDRSADGRRTGGIESVVSGVETLSEFGQTVGDGIRVTTGLFGDTGPFAGLLGLGLPRYDSPVGFTFRDPGVDSGESETPVDLPPDSSPHAGVSRVDHETPVSAASGREPVASNEETDSSTDRRRFRYSPRSVPRPRRTIPRPHTDCSGRTDIHEPLSTATDETVPDDPTRRSRGTTPVQRSSPHTPSLQSTPTQPASTQQPPTGSAIQLSSVWTPPIRPSPTQVSNQGPLTQLDPTPSSTQTQPTRPASNRSSQMGRARTETHHEQSRTDSSTDRDTHRDVLDTLPPNRRSVAARRSLPELSRPSLGTQQSTIGIPRSTPSRGPPRELASTAGYRASELHDHLSTAGDSPETPRTTPSPSSAKSARSGTTPGQLRTEGDHILDADPRPLSGGTPPTPGLAAADSHRPVPASSPNDTHSELARGLSTDALRLSRREPIHHGSGRPTVTHRYPEFGTATGATRTEARTRRRLHRDRMPATPLRAPQSQSRQPAAADAEPPTPTASVGHRRTAVLGPLQTTSTGEPQQLFTPSRTHTDGLQHDQLRRLRRPSSVPPSDAVDTTPRLSESSSISGTRRPTRALQSRLDRLFATVPAAATDRSHTAEPTATGHGGRHRLPDFVGRQATEVPSSGRPTPHKLRRQSQRFAPATAAEGMVTNPVVSSQSTEPTTGSDDETQTSPRSRSPTPPGERGGANTRVFATVDTGDSRRAKSHPQSDVVTRQPSTESALEASTPSHHTLQRRPNPSRNTDSETRSPPSALTPRDGTASLSEGRQQTVRQQAPQSRSAFDQQPIEPSGEPSRRVPTLLASWPAYSRRPSTTLTESNSSSTTLAGLNSFSTTAHASSRLAMVTPRSTLPNDSGAVEPPPLLRSASTTPRVHPASVGPSHTVTGRQPPASTASTETSTSTASAGGNVRDVSSVGRRRRSALSHRQSRAPRPSSKPVVHSRSESLSQSGGRSQSALLPSTGRTVANASVRTPPNNRTTATADRGSSSLETRSELGSVTPPPESAAPRLAATSRDQQTAGSDGHLFTRGSDSWRNRQLSTLYRPRRGTVQQPDSRVVSPVSEPSTETLGTETGVERHWSGSVSTPSSSQSPSLSLHRLTTSTDNSEPTPRGDLESRPRDGAGSTTGNALFGRRARERRKQTFALSRSSTGNRSAVDSTVEATAATGHRRSVQYRPPTVSVAGQIVDRTDSASVSRAARTPLLTTTLSSRAANTQPQTSEDRAVTVNDERRTWSVSTGRSRVERSSTGGTRVLRSARTPNTHASSELQSSPNSGTVQGDEAADIPYRSELPTNANRGEAAPPSTRRVGTTGKTHLTTHPMARSGSGNSQDNSGAGHLIQRRRTRSVSRTAQLSAANRSELVDKQSTLASNISGSMKEPSLTHQSQTVLSGSSRVDHVEPRQLPHQQSAASQLPVGSRESVPHLQPSRRPFGSTPTTEMTVAERPRSDDSHSWVGGQLSSDEEPPASVASPISSHADATVSDCQQVEAVDAGYDATVLSVANTERSPQPVAEPSDNSRQGSQFQSALSTGVDSSQRQSAGSHPRTQPTAGSTNSETPVEPTALDRSPTRSEQVDQDSRPRLTFKQPATRHGTAPPHTDSSVDQTRQRRGRSSEAAGRRTTPSRSTRQDQSVRRNQSARDQSTTESDPFEPVERPDSQPQATAEQTPLRRSADRRQDTDQRSGLDSTPDPTSTESLAYDADVDRLVETLYRRLERKLKIEREQQGF